MRILRDALGRRQSRYFNITALIRYQYVITKPIRMKQRYSVPLSDTISVPPPTATDLTLY